MDKLIGKEITYDEENINFIWYDGPVQFIFSLNDEHYLLSFLNDFKIGEEWHSAYSYLQIYNPNISYSSSDYKFEDGVSVLILDSNFIVVDTMIIFSFDFKFS